MNLNLLSGGEAGAAVSVAESKGEGPGQAGGIFRAILEGDLAHNLLCSGRRAVEIPGDNQWITRCAVINSVDGANGGSTDLNIGAA